MSILKMTPRHKNIPFFIPHEGCGFSCIFCSQTKITGVCRGKTQIDRECAQLEEHILKSKSTLNEGDTAEIAFFGGSFTGIEPMRMTALLDTASRHIGGQITGIRLSTRPDYINTEICEILYGYGVTAVELGIQSADDGVLAANNRGHSAEQSKKACELIRRYGFSLGGQMMCGLYTSTPESEIKTASSIVKWGCDSARIYPTVVFEGTKLYNLTLEHKYEPLTVEDAVTRAADCAMIFIKNGVKLLRIGLHASENLDKAPFGAVHPALGELVMGEIYYRLILPEAEKLASDTVLVLVPKGSLSQAIGQKKSNLKRLEEKTGKAFRFIQSEELCNYSIKVTDY